MRAARKYKPATPGQRGQRGWNAVPSWVTKTRFEIEVERLGLAEAMERELVESRRLRQFAKMVRNRHYVPEWLLEYWGITVLGDDLERG